MNTIATFSRPRQKLGLFLSVVMSMALLFTLLATSDIGRAQAQTTADSCVVPVSGDGTITGSWSSDCASEGRSGSYARFYTFTLGEPRDVAITLESQVNTYLYAREGEGTDGRIVYEDNDDDNSVFSLASSTDSGISESLGAGVYTIEATTVTPGEMGEFALTIRGVTGAYDALFNRYDANDNGQIDKDEVVTAINDYLFGEGITKEQVLRLINSYLFSPPPASDKVYTLRELAELEDEWEFSDPDISIRVQAYVNFVRDDVGDLTLWIRDAGYREFCHFDEAHRTAVTALSEGEQVTVDGTFNGLWLRDCVLVTGPTSEPAPPPAPEPPASDKVHTLRELAELEDEREFSDPDIRIRVQAYVHFVEDDIGNLILFIRDAGYSEYCYFDEAHRTAVTALSGEEQVTVDGTFNGTWLRDCVLVTGPTSTITFGDLNWSSVMLQNRIAQYIAEKGYGYSTSVESGTTRSLFQALRAGNIDVLMEVWLPNQEEDWEEALAEGAVSSPGRSLGTDWQSAFVIPKYLQEQYPDLDSVEDLKEEQYRSLFATDETDGKARLVSCVIGWQCEGVNAKQIEGYGLSEHVHIVNPASEYALFADLTEAYENEEPWLGYQWGTSESALLFDLVRLEEPAYSDECWETTMACAYEDNTILIAVNAGLSESAVDFVDVLTEWDFNVEEVYKPVVQWQGENPDTNTEDAAMWWLRENNDVWSQWVTADASAAIQEALDSDEIPDGWPEAPSITPEPTPTPSPTPEPPADSCVGTVSGDGTVSGSWSSDCASEGRSGSYASYHTFTLTETADVTITAESGVDTYLFLREGAGRDGTVVDENDDHDTSEFSLASTTDSGISESLDAGSYTIEVTTYTAGETGEFTLTVSGLPAAAGPQPTPGPTVTPTPTPAANAEAVFDGLIPELLEKWEVPGASVAIAKDGRLVLAKGYGLADVEEDDPVKPDSIYRIASISKPITAVAILQLVEEGVLDLEDKVFQILGEFQPPEGATKDPRLDKITVLHLLQHTGGWDRDQSYDPMWIPSRIQRELGVPKPVSCRDVIKFMLGQPLDFDPSARYAYSNFGYCLLGRVIEERTGQSYEEFVKERVFEPLGITRVGIGDTLREEKTAGEVTYYGYPGEELAYSVMPGTPDRVPWPYGGFYLRGRDSVGGWIASAIDLVRLATSIDGSRPPSVLKPASVQEMVSRPAPPLWEDSAYFYGMGWLVRPTGDDANWWHSGSQPGTSSLLVRTHHGFVWAALFNSRPEEWRQFGREVDQLMWHGVGEVSLWPSEDLFPQFGFTDMDTSSPEPTPTPSTNQN